MKCIISRTYTKDSTKGSFYIFDGEKLVYRCKCLELPDNGNQHNVSCIPEGVYDVVKTYTEKRGNHFRVLNVPDRTDILIHKGNYTRDTKGCILPGTYFTNIDFDEIIDIGESTKSLECLNQFLPESFKLYIL
jgi:hypothetical protein